MKTRIFTPRTSPYSTKRVTLEISRRDHRRIKRGQWLEKIKDLATGRVYLCKAVPCGLGCPCDAAIVCEVTTSS